MHLKGLKTSAGFRLSYIQTKANYYRLGILHEFGRQKSRSEGVPGTFAHSHQGSQQYRFRHVQLLLAPESYPPA